MQSRLAEIEEIAQNNRYSLLQRGSVETIELFQTVTQLSTISVNLY